MQAKKIEWKTSKISGQSVAHGFIDGNILVGRVVKDETFGYELKMDIGKKSCPAESIEKAKEIAQDYMDTILERMTDNPTER